MQRGMRLWVILSDDERTDIFSSVIREEKHMWTHRTVGAWITYCHYKGTEEDFHCPQLVILVDVFSIKDKAIPQVLSFLEYFDGLTYLKNFRLWNFIFFFRLWKFSHSLLHQYCVCVCVCFILMEWFMRLNDLFTFPKVRGRGTHLYWIIHFWDSAHFHLAL